MGDRPAHDPGEPRAPGDFHRRAPRPSMRPTCFSDDSSSGASSMLNWRPAAASNRACAALPDARISRSVIHSVAPRQQFHYRRRRLLDGAAGHVDYRPMHLREGPARLPHFGPHRLDVGIFRRPVVMEQVQSVSTQLDQPFGVVRQPDDQRVLGADQFWRQRHARHIGYVGDFDSPISEVQASGSLGGARDADETDICIVETPTGLAVVMVERKIHRIDACKIFAIKQVLFARHTAALPVQVGRQRADDRIENRYRWYLKPTAALLQELPEGVVDHREEDNSRIGLDPGYDAIDLTACSYHAPDVLDRLRVIELHEARSSRRVHGLTSGIRNQMEVEAGRLDPARIHPRHAVGHSMSNGEDPADLSSERRASTICERLCVAMSAFTSVFPGWGNWAQGTPSD